METRRSTMTEGAGAAMPERRVWLKRCIALAIAGLFSLALGELLFRMAYGVPLRERMPLMEVRANARRGFEMIPGTEHYTYLESVRVNDLGLRGPVRGEKREGEICVVALGDSLVYGQGVAEEDTISWHLEAELSGARACRVLNAGVRSYATEQEVALFEELLPKVAPDVAVLFWFANDVDDQRIQSTHERLSRTGPIVFDFGAPATEAAVFRWKVQQWLRRSALVMRLHDLWSEARYPEHAEADLDLAYAKVESEIARWKLLCAEHGVDALFAIIPLAKYLERTEIAPSTARAREIGERHGLPVVDLTPPLKDLTREKGRLPVLPYDGHYTGEANAVMARAIARELRERFPAKFSP